MQSETADFAPVPPPGELSKACASSSSSENHTPANAVSVDKYFTESFHYLLLLSPILRSIMWQYDVVHKTGST